MRISTKVGEHFVEVNVDRENGHYVVEIDGERSVVDAQQLEGEFYSILTDGRSYEVSVEAAGDGYNVRHGASVQRVTFTDPSRRAREQAGPGAGPERIVSQMPGKVARVLVSEGDDVAAGQGIVVVEAMKMENEITASKDGRVVSIEVKSGQAVEGGTLLAVIE